MIDLLGYCKYTNNYDHNDNWMTIDNDGHVDSKMSRQPHRMRWEMRNS
jgi:hypothetical protein